ncbi:MAG TPA: hypothetical protein ENJ95_10595 [Bacteroidetes bacterium]|nr:hypothetical protein [Bacteroidota bacterium]
MKNKNEPSKISDEVLNKKEAIQNGLTNSEIITEPPIEPVGKNENIILQNIRVKQNDVYFKETNKIGLTNNTAIPKTIINENEPAINIAKNEVGGNISARTAFKNNEKTIDPDLVKTNKDGKLNAIPYLSFNALKNQVNTPSVKTETKKGYKPQTRFSFEGGASVFMQPMGRLFSDSVSFDPGKTALSTGAGILFNFELNSKWILQGGFYYKNLKARNVKLGYNAFPLILRRRYAWGLNSHLEIKTGAAMNALVSAVNKEGGDVPGFKKSYLDLLAGAAYVSCIGEKMNLVIEPNFGYSLTAVANNKHAFNFGIYAGIRYNLL